MTRVKICGIRTAEDAHAAIEAGADAIGLLVGRLHASPDFIEPQLARAIVAEMPPFVSTVLVTHLADANSISALVDTVRPSTLQLHGESKIGDAAALRSSYPHLKIYKALHANRKAVQERVDLWSTHVDAILLDTSAPETDQVGGTGRTHNWAISATIAKTALKPVILAGGLNPSNVALAIAKVRPYAVDVNSGTKNASGYKDHAKMRQFIETAHNWDRHIEDIAAQRAIV